MCARAYVCDEVKLSEEKELRAHTHIMHIFTWIYHIYMHTGFPGDTRTQERTDTQRRAHIPPIWCFLDALRQD